MIEKRNYRLRKKEVHKLAVQMLCQLPLVARGTLIKVTDRLNVVIFAAAFRTSVNQASVELQGSPCASYVLGELANPLQDLDQQQRVINHILISKLPKRIRHRGQRVAIDLVDVPYHGTVKQEPEDEVRRSKAKSGTSHFFV